jgi:urease accessory protein
VLLLTAKALGLTVPLTLIGRAEELINGGIAIATLFIIPGDEPLVASLRSLAQQFHGEFAASAWNGFALVRLVAADGAALRHDMLLLLKAVRGAAVPRLWLN